MALPMLLVLAPIYFLLHFLVDTHHRGIVTARNEIAGVPVIAALSQLRHAVIEEAFGGDRDFNRAEASTARARLVEALTIWPDQTALKTQVGEALIGADRYLQGETSNPADATEIIARIGGMYAVTANASELILDPDLDTYYLMDLQVNRLPALISTLWTLHAIESAAPGVEGRSAERRARVESFKSLLGDQTQALGASAGFARMHQRDSGVSEALEKGLPRLETAIGQVIVEMEAGADISGAAILEVIFAARGVEQVLGDELVRLLSMRIAGFRTAMHGQIGLAVAMIVLVFVMMFLFLNRAVVRPVRRVTAAMGRLAAGDLDVAIAGAGGRDEIGEMVKAIGVFRDTAVTRIRLEQEAATAARLIEERTAALERSERAALLANWRYCIVDSALTWSATMYALTGFPEDEGPPGLAAIAARVNQSDLLRLTAAMESLSVEAPKAAFDLRLDHPEFGQRHMRLWIEVDFNERRLPRALFGTAQDVTELKEGQLALEARTRALAEAQAIGRIGDWSWRLGAPHIDWSAEIYDILGYDAATFSPELQTVLALYAEDSLALVSEAQRRILKHGGMESVDVRAWRGDGSIADVTVITKADHDEHGRIQGFVGTIQDITERKRAERDLEKLAFHDPLTGLANRALFQRSIRRYIMLAGENFRSAALFLIDLDKFKEVNDSLGHAAGDELLVIVAGKLKQGLPEDAFLARLGGDEFAVIAPDADKAAALAIGGRIIELLGEPLHLKQGEVGIGASIGCVLIPKDGVEADDLLRKADLALYRAKDDGRNRIQLFMPELSEVVQEKNRLARDLRRAMETEAGLEVHYQPQFDPARGRVTGYEALLRWKHPERGYVPPAEFIPIAESSALITDLGLWVLRESCRQMRAWLDAGHPERDVAVNVSAAQLWQGEFEADVRRVLAETRLPPHLLTLEVTESLFVREGEGRVSRILSNLRGLGVTLALDDFGTGYSSLGYLNQLPFQKLKIDRVFVSGVDAIEQRQRLLRGIIELGRGLGMTLIAEGAERPEEVEVLRRFGCDGIQGYIFARPAPAAEVMRVSAGIEDAWSRSNAA
jgi:diguanylate cyclase (GGDEF)-like protein/PAS domain S-box-containing protein